MCLKNKYTSNIQILLYLSGQNEMGANRTKPFATTKEYIWRQNKDYVGGAITRVFLPTMSLSIYITIIVLNVHLLEFSCLLDGKSSQGRGSDEREMARIYLIAICK